MNFQNLMNNVINELNSELNNENINISSMNILFTNINGNISNVLNESFNNSERQIKKTSLEFISNLKEEIMTNELIENDLYCSICLDKFKLGDKYIKLPCDNNEHYFHCGDTNDCDGIKPWLKENNTCPICRTEFPIEKEEENNEEQQPELPESLQSTNNTELSEDQINGLNINIENMLTFNMNDYMGQYQNNNSEEQQQQENNNDSEEQQQQQENNNSEEQQEQNNNSEEQQEQNNLRREELRNLFNNLINELNVLDEETQLQEAILSSINNN